MKTILTRPAVSSLFLTLGLMVAPLGASAQGEPSVSGDKPPVEVEAEQAAIHAQAKLEEAKAVTEVEQAAAVADLQAAQAETNSQIVAETRKAKCRASRVKMARHRREWVKFAFGKNETTGFDKEYFLGPSTRAEFVENTRQWLDFAFCSE